MGKEVGAVGGMIGMKVDFNYVTRTVFCSSDLAGLADWGVSDRTVNEVELKSRRGTE